MLDLKDPETQIQDTANFLLSTKEKYEAAGIDVQTVRMSTQRWETYPLERMPLGIPDAVADIETIAKKNGTMNFSITSVTVSGSDYLPGDNHDPDGDSDGSSILVAK